MCKRCIALLVACLITVGAFCPLVVVHAYTDESQLTEEELAYLDTLTEQDYLDATKLMNILATSGTISIGSDSIDLSHPTEENMAWLSTYGGHRFGSTWDNFISWIQENFIKGELQAASLENRRPMFRNVPLTTQDISNSVGTRGLYGYVWSSANTDDDDIRTAMLEATNYASLGINSAECYMPFETGAYAYGYNLANTSLICQGNSRMLTGDEQIIKRGNLDFYSKGTDGLPLYFYDTENNWPQSIWGDYNSQGYSLATLLDRVCTTQNKLAILIPSDPTLDTNCHYDYDILTRIDFGTAYHGEDNIRWANDITHPIEASSIDLTADVEVVYTPQGGEPYSYVVHTHPGSNFYRDNNSGVPLKPSLDSYGGPQSFSVYTQFNYGTDPNPTYDDTVKILYYLSGYCRNVDIYIGPSWSDCEQLIGGLPALQIKPPTTQSGDTLGYVQTPSNGTFDLTAFMLYLFHNQDNHNTNITINILPNAIFTTEPTGTPQPIVTSPPADLPTPSPAPHEIWVTPYDPPPNLFPIGDGYSDDTVDGLSQDLWSKSVASLYNPSLTPSIIPADSYTEIRWTLDDNGLREEYITHTGTGYNDVASDSPVYAAKSVLDAGTTFLGPIGEYIWYIVGFGILTSLLIKLLHN